jgi:hypothetical protein
MVSPSASPLRRFVLMAFLCVLLASLICGSAGFAAEAQAAGAGKASLPFFRITVVDEETSRGIPCVQLKTTNNAEYWTDSAGVVAFYEPDLMDQDVFFEARTHGYRMPRGEGEFHFGGVALRTTPGGRATIALRRFNIAQRLYRMTGAGIYRDSVLLGDAVPLVEEQGKVPPMGQDGSDMALFNNRYYWFWGDTLVARFPLGVFRSVGATSELVSNGGLDPDRGVALAYLRDEGDQIRGVINLPGKMYWYTLPRVARDRKGREHLMSDYVQIEGYMQVVERGLLEFDAKTDRFELVGKYPKDVKVGFEGNGGPAFLQTLGGKRYFYYPWPYPDVRCPADYKSQKKMEAREGFTCLKEGSRFEGGASQLDRDASLRGRL